jgi:hypothetical protein
LSAQFYCRAKRCPRRIGDAFPPPGVRRLPAIVLEARAVVFYLGAAGRLMPRFHVRETFAINDKSVFVMAGFVIEGEPVAGMRVRLPFKEGVLVTADIDHIQHLRRPDGDVVCLCIRCADPQEVTLWEAMKIKDQTVDIIPAHTPP